jgi:hypothetical protein
MEKAVSFSNRVIWGSGEGQNAINVGPQTLQPSAFCEKIVTSYVVFSDVNAEEALG